MAKVDSRSNVAAREPFSAFCQPLRPPSALGDAITAAYRRPEPEILPGLIEQATLPVDLALSIEATARRLVTALRAQPRRHGVSELIHEYKLSSREGVVLMCLAEALLRIPDSGTRNALIRDKIAAGDWRAHLAPGRSLFVNAASWGLLVTGTVARAANDETLAAALTRVVVRGGEPLVRAAVDFAMRLLGERFVTGRTIEEALVNARALEAQGFLYSYDMLGEAAVTAADAERYFADYEHAFHAVGAVAAGRGVHQAPGVSIKLSALHPRYARAQTSRVMGELLPRLIHLARLARRYEIGLNIDAEEVDRLELSLPLLEGLCADPELAGWRGIGFVIQAYGKRCPAAIDYVIDLARRTRQRLMVRLVKGAYWDAEIKRAQLDGLEGFPVYSRKIYTDVAYVACAKKLLAAPDAIFPQFATHNAQTLATIYHLAGPEFEIGQFEFQCIHGMGEPLYSEVVKPLGRPCRIYAPVGTHETLLAYLARRILENGANSSFVNRLADESIPVGDLVKDPVDLARAIQPLGAPHGRIALPRELFGAERANSRGLDLANEAVLAGLAKILAQTARAPYTAAPLLADGPRKGEARPVLNPADRRDVVGQVVDATPADVEAAFRFAVAAAPAWAATDAAERGALLMRAADLFETRLEELLGLIVREAGRTVANAVGEVRETVDFLRYYGVEARERLGRAVHEPLGPTVCISPWNFPLSIFVGQIAAALAAGNPVLAKPAEETPLIADFAVRILREAGIPAGVVQLLTGAGEVGAALVGHGETRAVMFTGSTEVARSIQRQLSMRLAPDGSLVPLIAETGGQNAMIVDASALAEQVVADVISSAFDSAGQRCSALRVLCLQEETADRMLEMLKGALAELKLGNPDRLETDIGPVISAEAEANLRRHVASMRAKGRRIESLPLPSETDHGTFYPPTLIEIDSIDELEREVFGPVLHVMRYRRDRVERLVERINATGYGLTFGLHTRIDATVDRVTAQIRAGNIYVNRNTIGATVGVQPFGGLGLSGTGPKAGGPLYLMRLLKRGPAPDFGAVGSDALRAPARAYVAWLRAHGHAQEAERCARYAESSLLGAARELPGPVGELNVYSLHERGTMLLVPETETGLLLQLGAVFATGNKAVVAAPGALGAILRSLPSELARRVATVANWSEPHVYAGILAEGNGERLVEVARAAAAWPGPIVPLQGVGRDELASGRKDYALEWLLEERSVSINTAAAGGNASLVAVG
jgi:RHH-type proline utilization regulon transcriptional repressor/proline dehydrogenase/delta 1-pyrroline-5-carboxylate dehydrogenase